MTSNDLKRNIKIAALVLWGLILFALSTMPVGDGPGLVPDKVAHVIIYLPLGALILINQAKKALISVSLAAALSGAYGLLLELMQAMLPWRGFEWMDAASNLAGGAAGALLAFLMTGTGNAVHYSQPKR